MRFYLNRSIEIKQNGSRTQHSDNFNKNKPSKVKTQRPKITLGYLLDYFYTNTSEITQETPLFHEFIEYLKTNPNYVNYFKNRTFLQYAPAKLTELAYAQISPGLDFQNYGREIEINPKIGISVINSLDELDLTLESTYDEDVLINTQY